jgi:deoxyribodipyrimidine photo-lyase
VWCDDRCGLPEPVVDVETRRQAFWTRHEQRRSDAARELRRPEIARRASFSGGDRSVTGQGDAAVAEGPSTSDDTQSPMPTGISASAGEPAPDDETAVPGDPADDGSGADRDGDDDASDAQTSIQRFE